MSHIRITYTGVSAANRILQRAIQEMAEVEETSLKIGTQIDPEISACYQIRERIQNCHRSAERIYQTMGELLEATSSGLMEYRMIEIRLKQAASMNDRVLAEG